MEIEGLERLSKAKDKHIQQKEDEKLQFEEEIRRKIEQLLDQEDRSDPIPMKVLFMYGIHYKNLRVALTTLWLSQLQLNYHG